MRALLAVAALAASMGAAQAQTWYAGVQGMSAQTSWRTPTHTHPSRLSGGGLVAGVQWPIGIVRAGMEVDGQLESMPLLLTLAPPLAFDSARRWSASVRGRLGAELDLGSGWWVQPYVAAGPSWIGVHYDIPGQPRSGTGQGWTVGGGVEVGQGAVFGRAEYRWAHYTLPAPLRSTTSSEVRLAVGVRW